MIVDLTVDHAFDWAGVGLNRSMVITPCDQGSYDAPCWCETKPQTVNTCNVSMQVCCLVMARYLESKNAVSSLAAALKLYERPRWVMSGLDKRRLVCSCSSVAWVL